MAKIFDKVLGFMGFEEEEVEEIIEDDDNFDEVYDDKRKKNTPVISLQHAQKQMKVVVMEPFTFEDAQGIADNLKNRRPVIVNLEDVEKDMAKRIVDFISGTTYALNGSMQKVGNGIFLFVPSNIDIAGEFKEDAKEKSAFPWTK
jgi:cell division inhibitor SepF